MQGNVANVGECCWGAVVEGACIESPCEGVDSFHLFPSGSTELPSPPPSTRRLRNFCPRLPTHTISGRGNARCAGSDGASKVPLQTSVMASYVCGCGGREGEWRENVTQGG